MWRRHCELLSQDAALSGVAERAAELIARSEEADARALDAERRALEASKRIADAEARARAAERQARAAEAFSHQAAAGRPSDRMKTPDALLVEWRKLTTFRCVNTLIRKTEAAESQAWLRHSFDAWRRAMSILERLAVNASRNASRKLAPQIESPTRIRAELADSEQQLAVAVAEADESFARLATARRSSERELECKLRLASLQAAVSLGSSLKVTLRGALLLQRCLTAWNGATRLARAIDEHTVEAEQLEAAKERACQAAELRTSELADMVKQAQFCIETMRNVESNAQIEAVTAAEYAVRAEAAEQRLATVSYESYVVPKPNHKWRPTHHEKDVGRLDAVSDMLVRSIGAPAERQTLQLCFNEWQCGTSTNSTGRRIQYLKDAAELARIDTDLVRAELNEETVRTGRLESEMAKAETWYHAQSQVLQPQPQNGELKASSRFVNMRTPREPVASPKKTTSPKRVQVRLPSQPFSPRQGSQFSPSRNSPGSNGLVLMIVFLTWRQLICGKTWLHVKVLHRSQNVWQNAVRLRSSLAAWRHSARSSSLLRWRWRARGLALLRVAVGAWRLAVFELRGPNFGCPTPTHSHPQLVPATGAARHDGIDEGRSEGLARQQRINLDGFPRASVKKAPTVAAQLRSSSSGQLGGGRKSSVGSRAASPATAVFDHQDTVRGRVGRSSRNSIGQRESVLQGHQEPQHSHVTILQLTGAKMR